MARVIAPVAEPVSELRERAAKQALWDKFSTAHDIAGTSVPLFATGRDGDVEVFPYGRDGRPMLRRSAEMQELLATTVERVLVSDPGSAEGILFSCTSLTPRVTSCRFMLARPVVMAGMAGYQLT